MRSSARRGVTATGVLLASISACLVLAVGPAAAAPADTFSQVAVNTSVNLCNGETVVLVGTAHFAIKLNPDFTSTWHVVIHAEGVGDQGNPYLFNVERQSVFAAGGAT